MPLTYLKNKLTDYELSKLDHSPLLMRGPEDPTFCLMQKNRLFKKINHHKDLIWITPDPFLFYKKKTMQSLNTIYFVKKQKDGSLLSYDQRYLKTRTGLYMLPPVQVDMSTFFLKTQEIQELESQLFAFQRNTPFYFKGDSLDRLSSPAYLRALQARQIPSKQSQKASVYLYLKDLIDR